MVFKLPDRVYWDIPSLMSEWRVDDDTLWQYINDLKALRPAIKFEHKTSLIGLEISDSLNDYIDDLANSSQLKISEHGIIYLGDKASQFSDIVRGYKEKLGVEFELEKSDFHPLPRFVYLRVCGVASTQINQLRKWVSLTFENFNRNKFLIVTLNADKEMASFTTDINAINLHCVDMKQRADKMIFPSEEKVRFENEYSLASTEEAAKGYFSLPEKADAAAILICDAGNEYIEKYGHVPTVDQLKKFLYDTRADAIETKPDKSIIIDSIRVSERGLKDRRNTYLQST